VYRIDPGRPRSHEQGGKRLGLVLSPSDSPLSVVTIIPTSTSAGPSIHRPEFEVAGRLTRLPIDQIRSIEADHAVGDPVDCLTRDQLALVELALAHYLGFHDALPPRSS
jgi:mRNA interferase MazF